MMTQTGEDDSSFTGDSIEQLFFINGFGFKSIGERNFL